MQLTPDFVAALMHLRAQGYERVCSVIGRYMSTTYVKFWTLDELIEMSEEYKSVRAVPPTPRRGMWTGRPNTRHIRPGKDIRTNQVIPAAEQLIGHKIKADEKYVAKRRAQLTMHSLLNTGAPIQV